MQRFSISWSQLSLPALAMVCAGVLLSGPVGHAAVPAAQQAIFRAEAFSAAHGAMTSSAADAMTHVAAQLGQGDSDLARIVRQRESLNRRIADLRKRIQSAADTQGTSLQAISAQAQVGALRDEEAGLSRELATLESQIEEKFPSFTELTRPLPLAAADTQALLASDEAMVLVLPAQDATYIWAMTRDRFDWARSTLKPGQITEAVHALRRNLDPAPASHPSQKF